MPAFRKYTLYSTSKGRASSSSSAATRPDFVSSECLSQFE